MSLRARTWGNCLCPCIEARKQSDDDKKSKPVGEQDPDGCSAHWTSSVTTLHRPFLWLLKVLSSTSARYPIYMMLAVSTLAIALITSAMSTSFVIETDETVLWTPQNSQSMIDAQWVARRGYFGSGRYLTLFFHADGDDVLSRAHVERIFEAVDRIRSVPGYNKLCEYSYYIDPNTLQRTCEIEGVTRFWNSSSFVFQVKTTGDEDTIAQMSNLTYPDGFPIREDRIFGQSERQDETEDSLLVSLKSYFIYIYLPYHWTADEFELRAMDEVFELEEEWRQQDRETGTFLTVEVNAGRSFNDEFVRGIFSNLPLVAVVAVAMITFACCVFYKRHRLHSRVMVGLAAVAAVALSMMAGFGIVIFCGIPFTTVSILIPFILFGIGMDDAFIIYGDYSRTDPNVDTVKRIEQTIDDVGISITLTTITSTFAFGIGCISEIPAVSWLCYYAFPSVISVYLYQLTFFVAAIALDERRIKASRQDPFFCCKYEPPQEQQLLKNATSSDSEGHDQLIAQNDVPEESWIDARMAAYGEFLLSPGVKVAVVALFGILGVAGAISASQLRQEFEYSDVLPDDSYLSDFYAARGAYAVPNQLQAGAFFRYVDQSSKNVQQQMKDFVADLVAMEGVTGEPDFFWLREFETFVEDTPFVQSLEFNDQLGFFLGVPLYAELFRRDIRFDGDGNVLSSRVFINMYDVDQEVVSEQIDMLKRQREVSVKQPVNEGRAQLAFFTSAQDYNEWEFYNAAVEEMVLTAILGITVVTAIAFISVPHWTAGLIVFPMIALLYVDLLGVMQWGGVPINAVSYVTLAMSIGLMVDFILHILLRYYESPGDRKEKTITTLRTMGSSILIGGLSTFLGTLPLAFSTYNMFRSVFIIFVGLVVLGMAHGLILLPVLLSIMGTEEQVTTKAHSRLERIRTADESISSNESPTSRTGPIANISASVLATMDDATAYLISSILEHSKATTKRIAARPDPPNKPSASSKHSDALMKGAPIILHMEMESDTENSSADVSGVTSPGAAVQVKMNQGGGDVDQRDSTPNVTQEVEASAELAREATLPVATPVQEGKRPAQEEVPEATTKHPAADPPDDAASLDIDSERIGGGNPSSPPRDELSC